MTELWPCTSLDYEEQIIPVALLAELNALCTHTTRSIFY